MQCLRTLCNTVTKSLLAKNIPSITNTRTIKYYPPPPNYDDIELPEKPKLRFFEKNPIFNSNIKPPKMQKRLRYMRGPETLHNTLVHKQYGIAAKGGGRMRHEHFEMVRLAIAHNIDTRRMFAIWRVDPPWQPVTKKGQGQRMGGGKGGIDHYVSPIKAERIIMELGGKCEYGEVKSLLRGIAARLPFAAIPISQELLDKQLADEKARDKANLNLYTMKYVIQNNMGGCHKWISPVDHKWFGRYR